MKRGWKQHEAVAFATDLNSARNAFLVLGENNMHRGDKSLDRKNLERVVVLLTIRQLVLHPADYQVM